jgi:DNA-binding SARP family transcriptional activator
MSTPKPALTVNARAEREPARGIELRVLGPLTILGAGRDGSELIESRFHVRALLALLASSDEPMPRDQLLETLWPDRSPDAARNRLYHTVHLLKDALTSIAGGHEWIALDQGQVRLSADVQSDARRLERAMALLGQGRLTDADLQQAIKDSVGAWGLALGEALEASELGRSLRAQFAAWHLALLQEAGRRAAANGDSTSARATLAELLAREPADEWAHQQLMRWDFAAQRWHAVLQRHALVQRELAQRLGLRPSLATAELAERAREAARHAQPAGQRPVPLIGREALSAQLREALDGSPGVWNVHGLAGVGKTSLLKEVVRTCAAHFEDGVIEVALGDLDSDESAIDACTRLMRFATVAGESATQRLQRMLRTRHLLLVVDDADQRRDVQALIEAVQSSATSAGEGGDNAPMAVAAVVLITRKAIEAASIHDIAVGPLAVPAEQDEAEVAVHAPAVALFFSRCPQVMPQPDAQIIDEVSDLVRELDGLPLAIEFAAARTAMMTPAEILRSLRHSLALLAETPGMVEARHPSMQAALDWSVGLLSAQARELYMAASVFAGAFEARALKALADPPWSDEAVGAGVQELVRCGLLELSAQTTHGPAVRMLHLPRAHARSLAQVQGRWMGLQQRRLEVLHAQLPQLPTYCERGFVVAMRTTAGLHEDVVGVLPHASACDPARFVDLVVALGRYWRVAPMIELGLRWLDEASSSARQRGDPVSEVRLAVSTSALLYYGGRIVEALDQVQAAREIAIRLSDAALTALATFHCCGVLPALGRIGEVGPLVAQTIEDCRLSEADGNYWVLQARLWSLRWHGASRSGPQPSAELLASLRPRLEDTAVWPQMLSTAGLQLMIADRPADGLVLADEMTRLGRELQAPMTEFMGLEVRSYCELALDLAFDADRTLAQAVQIVRAAGLDGMTIHTECRRAAVALYRDDPREALQHLARCMAIRRWPDSGPGPQLIAYRGIAAFLQGDSSLAHSSLREAVALADQCQQDHLIAVAELGALVALQVGWKDRSHEITRLLHQVDEVLGVVPLSRRFREKHLPHVSRSTEETVPEHYKLLKQRLVDVVEALALR